MAMMRPGGKPYKIAKKLLGQEGKKVPKPDVIKKGKPVLPTNLNR